MYIPLYQHPKLLSHFEFSYHYFFSVLIVCHQFCDKDIHIYTIFRFTHKKYQHQISIPKQAYSSKSDHEKFGSHPKINKFKMTEQHLLTAYTSALAKVTRVIREQVRLIEENNAPAIFEYQRRINREMADFAETWGVTIRIEVRPTEVKDQPSTLNHASTRRQRQRRRINFLPFEAPQSQRFSPTNFYNFIYSLPYIRRDSLGEDTQDKQCSICYYPFFEARGRAEAEVIRKGTAPRPNMKLEPHKVPISDLPELPMCLPCGHVFGHICVQIWIIGEESGDPPTCPICRAIWRPVGWSRVPSGQVTIVV